MGTLHTFAAASRAHKQWGRNGPKQENGSNQFTRAAAAQKKRVELSHKHLGRISPYKQKAVSNQSTRVVINETMYTIIKYFRYASPY